MDKITKRCLIVTAFGVCLFAALMNLSDVLGFFNQIIGLILPIIVGCILAMFINVPVTGFEKLTKKLFAKTKSKPSDKLIRVISFILTLLCIALVLVIVLTLLIPELSQSAGRLYNQVNARLPQWRTYLREHNINAAWLEGLLGGISIDKLTQNLSGWFDVVFQGAVNTAFSAVNIAVSAVFGLIIAIYITLGKDRLRRHSCKLIRAYLKPSWAENILKFCRMFNSTFAKFLSGQCGEALILGSLMYISFLIFRLPYASLVGVLTAICAIIPYFGAFISCSVSVFLTLIIAPSLAIRCLLVYCIVQFIENQFIYPRVVGSYVGLPPLYTLVAALIGGKLFGIIGILFFIPLAAVIIEFVKESAAKREAERKSSGGTRAE